jgi:cell division cycle 14
MKLLDCLGGLEYAIRLGWFNYKTFNLAEYEHYEKIENGDLNWIVPHKFVAFSSPSDKTIDKYGVFLTRSRIGPSPPMTTRPSLRSWA